MPAPQVQGDHVTDRVIAGVGDEPAVDTRSLAGAVTVAPVKDGALMQDDWLTQTVVADVLNKSREVTAVD